VNAWLGCSWGAIGGLVVELLELYRAVRRCGGLPWKKDPDNEPHPPALALAAVTRMSIGAAIAGAMTFGHQISGAFGGLTAGVTAPLVIDQIGQRERAPQPRRSQSQAEAGGPDAEPNPASAKPAPSPGMGPPSPATGGSGDG
jgi:hypothetical protein